MSLLNPIQGIRVVKDTKLETSNVRAASFIPAYSLTTFPAILPAGALVYNTAASNVYVSTGAAWVAL
jgi:hypothetical protein